MGIVTSLSNFQNYRMTCWLTTTAHLKYPKGINQLFFNPLKIIELDYFAIVSSIRLI